MPVMFLWFHYGFSHFVVFFFFFKQKTAYEIGTGDWSSDVCSSDLDLCIAFILLTDGEVYHPFVDLNDRMYMFVADLCRLVSLRLMTLID